MVASREVGFRDETKELIDRYTKNGTLSYKQAYSLFKAENYEDIAQTLHAMLSISDDSECRIWMQVVHNVWIGAYNDEERSTVFNENENVFFRELLKNKGVLSRKKVLSKILRTPYMTDKVATNLDDLGVIDVYKLQNGEVIYTLSMNFLSEVRTDG